LKEKSAEELQKKTFVVSTVACVSKITQACYSLSGKKSSSWENNAPFLVGSPPFSKSCNKG